VGPRHRWKMLTSSYIRCDIPGGFDLAQGACKPRVNVHCLCNVLVGLLLALQESSAVVWMTKESSINFREGKISSYLQSTQATSEASPASYSVHAQGKVAEAVSTLLISLFCQGKNVWSYICCTAPPLYSLTLWCLMKHRDSFMLYEVFSC
jgi:hypothetical protein